MPGPTYFESELRGGRLGAAIERVNPKLHAAIIACIATRGKNRGYVTASPPRGADPYTLGVWRSLANSIGNPRAGIFALIFARGDEREGFEAAESLTASGFAAWVRRHGARPFAHSLAAMEG